MSKPAGDNDEFNLNEFLAMADMKQNISFKINKREESYLESDLNYFCRAIHDIQSVLLVSSFMSMLELNWKNKFIPSPDETCCIINLLCTLNSI